LPSSADSIHFLKSKLCVGCVKGFEIVDLETLDTQGLLDPADSSLDFVQKRESTRPIAIYRIDGEFLLCYDEFAFYVNKNGWRTKANWLVQWEGRPTHFGTVLRNRVDLVNLSAALHHPFVLAFEPTFVEVRHVESGALLQIVSALLAGPAQSFNLPSDSRQLLTTALRRYTFLIVDCSIAAIQPNRFLLPTAVKTEHVLCGSLRSQFDVRLSSKSIHETSTRHSHSTPFANHLFRQFSPSFQDAFLALAWRTVLYKHCNPVSNCIEVVLGRRSQKLSEDEIDVEVEQLHRNGPDQKDFNVGWAV
jgi:hypothetical protein